MGQNHRRVIAWHPGMRLGGSFLIIFMRPRCIAIQEQGVTDLPFSLRFSLKLTKRFFLKITVVIKQTREKTRFAIFDQLPL